MDREGNAVRFRYTNTVHFVKTIYYAMGEDAECRYKPFPDLEKI
jgi:hypothetical protein